MLELPPRIAELVAVLSAIRGAVSVTLGGSRASGDADPSSDWDLGLYYRGEPDLTPIARYGEVHPPGAWGRIMNGGAWLALEGLKVDVLLRDLGRRRVAHAAAIPAVMGPARLRARARGASSRSPSHDVRCCHALSRGRR